MTDRTAVETVEGVEGVKSIAADITGTTSDNDAKASDVTVDSDPAGSTDSVDLAETTGTPVDGAEVAERAPEKADGTDEDAGTEDSAAEASSAASDTASETASGPSSSPDADTALITGGPAAPPPTAQPAGQAPGNAAGNGSEQPAEKAAEKTSPLAPPSRTVADAARGTRFAGRYRLEDRLSSNGKSATWRAVDEKLRRAVGIHLVAAGSEHSRSVMAAARAAALVGDPRFVQVLDAAEEDGLVYVVKEWLPDADNLASLLAVNPLPPHEAYEMARSVADAMAVAHRAGLSHLRLDPDNILRMHTGQYKIVGLSVEAALYGHDTTDAARDDTRAIGSLLYACLARRWPEAAAYGLPEAPRTSGRLCTPGQVKAHVHGPLEAVSMRALGHEYKHQPPFETPEDVVSALAAIPPVLPPEPAPPVSAAGADFDDEYTPSAMLGRRGGFNGGPPPAAPTRMQAGPPPALGGGFGRAVKVLVQVIVLVAVVLTTWQIAAHVKDNGEKPSPSPSGGAPTTATQPAPVPPASPLNVKLPVSNATELSLDQNGRPTSDAPGSVRDSYDGNPATSWKTKSYDDGPEAKIRTGIGVIYDLGSVQDLRTATIELDAAGDHTTLHLYTASANASSPSGLADFTELKNETTRGDKVVFTLDQPQRTRYVLVWMTAMPYQTANAPDIHRSGYQNSFAEVSFTS